MENKLDNDFIKAHINDFILSTLISGEKYGYEIADAIKQRTNNQFELKQPTMYAALQRLEKNGFIKSTWKDSDIGGKRHYYSLAEKGVNELNKNRQIWNRSLDVVSDFFGAPFFQSSKIQTINTQINEEIADVKKSVGVLNSADAKNLPLKDIEVAESAIQEQVADIESKRFNKSFLDNFNEDKLDYNQNLELFTDAMNRLRNNKKQANNNEDNMINFVSNVDAQADASLLKEQNDSSVIIGENCPEPTLFDLAEKNENISEANISSDAEFLTSDDRNYNFVDETETFEKISIPTDRVASSKKQDVNDAVFISQPTFSSPAFSNLDPTDIEQRIIENAFTSDDFNLQINYVSSPIKFDDVAKKALYDEKQFKRSVLDKRYSMSNSTKWNNIKLSSKFYNVNKLNFAALILTIPYFILAFIGTYLLAHFTKTISNVFTNSLFFGFALLACVVIYLGFELYTCPNKKAEYKKNNLHIVYSLVISIISILIIFAIYLFGFSESLWLNVYTYVWLNSCVFAFSIFVYSLIRHQLIKYTKNK